jgi:hypothetical protein
MLPAFYHGMKRTADKLKARGDSMDKLMYEIADATAAVLVGLMGIAGCLIFLLS